MPRNCTPLEDEEQTRFVQWLEERDLRLTSVPNSTYTPSFSQKMKNRRTGLRAGFPDLVVLIKPHQSHDGRGYFLCIEMKRQQGSTVSTKQREWIAAINGLGCDQVESVVAHGCDEAVEYVTGYLNASAQALQRVEF